MIESTKGRGQMNISTMTKCGETKENSKVSSTEKKSPSSSKSNKPSPRNNPNYNHHEVNTVTTVSPNKPPPPPLVGMSFDTNNMKPVKKWSTVKNVISL